MPQGKIVKTKSCTFVQVLFKMKVLIFVFAVVIGCGKKPDFGIGAESIRFGQTITYNNKVDVLWIVDDSESMELHQNAIAQQFGSFVDVLTQNSMDFNIAITTTDMSGSGEKGGFVGSPKVLNSLLPEVKDVFFNSVRVGISGSPLSRGLEAMKAALSPTLLAGGNRGFLRPDARLVIIFVSDDDDHSAGTAASYASFLDQVRPEFAFKARGWMVNFIGVTTLGGGCLTGTSRFGYPGERYMELAKNSFGIAESICSADMASALRNIRSRIVGMITEYVLERSPIDGTLFVYVDGVQIPADSVNGYSYNTETRVVRFNGKAVPGPDSAVKIEYQPATSK